MFKLRTEVLAFSETPFDHFLPTGLFPVHQYTRSVDFSCKPGGQDKSTDKAEHGSCQLPIRHGSRYAKRNPSHHDDGRSEGDDAGPNGQGAARIAEYRLQDDKGEDDGHGDGEHQLLRFLRVFIDYRADGGKQGGVKEVSTQEIEQEAADDQHPVNTFDDG